MEYTLIRKRKNKKAYLRVKDGAVVVTAPFTMPKREIDQMVEGNKAWILEQLNKQKVSYFEDGTIFQVLHETYTLKVYPDLKKAGINNHVLYVKNLDWSLKEILKKWFYSIAIQRFDLISQRLNIHGYTLKIGFYKSKWGSCTPAKKIITLNAYLLFTDIEIIDAIIYHEFAHTKYFNHSSAFYNQVLTWYPSYYIHHKRLNSLHYPRIK
ncbi:MAG: DUF45 domain-containing protein [Firmicutes bacterium]|nr:DUF45 domain-containing protein [Bacillota bacterium]